MKHEVKIIPYRNKYVLIDVKTGDKWANEYFKNLLEAICFINQNGLTLIK